MKTDTSLHEPVVSGTNYSLFVGEQEFSCPASQQKFVPRSLCRCGHSGHKPFCDGNHTNADWLPALKSRYPQANRFVRL